MVRDELSLEIWYPASDRDEAPAEDVDFADFLTPEFFERLGGGIEILLVPTVAMRDVPALIKSYLRLGGFVGDGAYVDHAFNTTDVCLVMDTDRITETARLRLAGAAAL